MLGGPTLKRGIYGRPSRQQATVVLADAAQRRGGCIWGAKRKNRARDFTHGKPSHFVILGVLFTAVFALMLFGIVKLVLVLAGL